MSQKESLTLAKDMIELQSKELGYSGKWLKAAEGSVRVETVVGVLKDVNLNRVHFNFLRSTHTKSTK
jgi:hypothetical protein